MAHAKAQYTQFLFAFSRQLLLIILNCGSKHGHEGTVTTNLIPFSS